MQHLLISKTFKHAKTLSVTHIISLPNKSIKLLYANNYHDCNFNKTKQKGYTSLTLPHRFWESSTLLQLLELDCDAAGAGARCCCWFFLEILLFEGVRWTAHGVAPGFISKWDLNL
jgi:hypothetical protein